MLGVATKKSEGVQQDCAGLIVAAWMLVAAVAACGSPAESRPMNHGPRTSLSSEPGDHGRVGLHWVTASFAGRPVMSTR